MRFENLLPLAILRLDNFLMDVNLNKILLFLFLLSFPIQSYSRDVSFSWTANSEPSVIGYYLYYKEGSAASYDGTGLINAAGPADKGHQGAELIMG